MFRSRLEAAWGEYLTAAGLKWEYESGRYRVGTGRYTPDFWLPTVGVFVEVKPLWPPLEKLLAFAGLGNTLLLVIGLPWSCEAYRIDGAELLTVGAAELPWAPGR